MIAYLMIALLQTMPATAPAETTHIQSFEVTPRAVDDASYRLHLRPDSVDPLSGNAALDYMRAALQVSSGTSGEADNPHRVIGDLTGTPPADLPKDEAADAVARAVGFKSTLALAVRRVDCAWQVALPEQGYAALLPDLNSARQAANVLSVESDLAVGHGISVEPRPWNAAKDEPVTTHELDAAGIADVVTENARLQFGWAEDMTEQGFLVSYLVAIGMDAQVFRDLQQFLERPDAANLGPALRVLSMPVLDLPRVIAVERQSMYATFPQLQAVRDHADVTEAECERLWSELRPALLQFAPWIGDKPVPEDAFGFEQVLTAANAWHRGRGLSEETLAGMGEHKVVMTFMVGDVERLLHDLLAAGNQPTYDRQLAALRAVEQTIGENPGNPLRQFVPTFSRTLRTGYRDGLQLNRLRVLEAPACRGGGRAVAGDAR